MPPMTIALTMANSMIPKATSEQISQIQSGTAQPTATGTQFAMIAAAVFRAGAADPENEEDPRK